MNSVEISFIIPVYNRPNEIKELLHSFVGLDTENKFEIIIIEDGSSLKCDKVIASFSKVLNISYYFKNNSGPGDSRNYGMRKAKGNYFIILDSDCILPKNYMSNLFNNLKFNYSDCFGGVDDAKNSFSNFQKAVSFSMTSFITTGHLRGGKKYKKFEPRSFNMGISKKAFLESGGFGKLHPGEDPDLSIRLNLLGFSTKLYSDVVVFHKRRITITSFFRQVYKFGVARIILNKRYKNTQKLIYWLPSIFCIGLVFSIILSIFNVTDILIIIYMFYLFMVFINSFYRFNLIVGLISIITTIIQFFGYGFGFLKSYLKITLNPNKKVQEIFPKMFFK